MNNPNPSPKNHSQPIKLAVLPGDGIGPEVMEAALSVLKVVASTYDLVFELKQGSVGGHAIDHYGKALPDETLKLCEASDAILFGSVGGPKWETLPPQEQPERASLLPLRKHFDLYANFRPAVVYPELLDASPLKNNRLTGGLNILIVRELTSGIYFGQPKGREGSGADERGFDTMSYRRYEIERIAHLAFKAASRRQKKLVSVDKANVLTTMVLWREVITEVAKTYPDVTLSHLYVDNAAMQLVNAPQTFDVMVASNMFGDILSDEAAMITGSIGMLPSASLSEDGFGLYEPIGGTAPDIAGKNLANPIAQILSVAMLLEHSFALIEPARAIEQAIHAVLAESYRTADIVDPKQAHHLKVLSTSEMGSCIAEKIKR